MTEKELSNKCDICGLKQTCPDDTDNLFQTIHLLSEKGIIPKKIPRKLCICVEGDKETCKNEFCLISHPSWSSKEQPCDAWQLNVDLPKGDFLAINLASEATKSAKETERLTNKLYIFTLVIVIFTAIQICVLLKPEIEWILSILIR